MDIFSLVADFYSRIFNLLFSTTFFLAGLNVSYGAILVAFLVVGFGVSLFWKGART